MAGSEMVEPVRQYFLDLQASICDALEKSDGAASFRRDPLEMPNGGFSQPSVLAEGKHIEKAAVQFSHSIGDSLPPAATERNPHLAGHRFQAAAISLIVHPRNPHAPTTHMNLRFFLVEADSPDWYFGGGYDLTPFYPYEEDILHWHRTAADACGEHYAALKSACDEYFFLTHRGECRGIGGVFFDDWKTGGFDTSFDFVRRVGDTFTDAYVPILDRRKEAPYSESEREFQLIRRGRYAEFNLVIDRGTKYGLQSGRRVEAVLASLPPLARWVYDYQPEPGTREAELSAYLEPRDWLAELDGR